MNKMEQTNVYRFTNERAAHWQVFPSPTDGAVVKETPPTFVWISIPCEPPVTYHVTVRNADGTTVWETDTEENTATPDIILSQGTYQWNLTAPTLGAERGWQSFTVAGDAVPFLRPTAAEVLAGLPSERPRHLFCKSDLPLLKKTHTAELETLKRNIALAYTDGMPARPMFHRAENALPYREYFGRFRDFCDRNMVACALGAYLLDTEEERNRAGAFAKELFLTICDWNPNGPCSLNGGYGDEIGLSCARILPSVFDLLYPFLNDRERAYGAETVAAYAYQCERRLDRLNYSLNPGNSHAGRLPAYLGEAALVLSGLPDGMCSVCNDTLTRWLSKALAIYGGMFPYFGGNDGGWAEGTFYATSYTKWFLPFFSCVKRYTKLAGQEKSFFVRPFYRNYAKFLLHFALPDHENHPFGDGYWCSPESPEWPGFFAQNPFRVYATLSGLPEARSYEKKLGAPKLFSLHLLDVFLPLTCEEHTELPPCAPPTDADAFPDVGFVSLHSDRTKPETDLHLMARASKFGPGSHRQPDNGSFALYYGGTALVSPSGYFGREYGTAHHMKWYNTTKAQNAILIDGIGQDFGNFRHTGKILSCECCPDGTRKAVLDLSASYPMIGKWIRTLVLNDSQTVTVLDTVEADTPVSVMWCLHFLSPAEGCGDGTLDTVVVHNGITLHISPDADTFQTVQRSDAYDVDLNEGVPAAYRVTMPPQYHLYYTTEKKTRHTIRVKLYIEK